MSKDASKKLYVCNRKRCRNCYSACSLTSDVRFAAIDDTVVIADGITGAWIPCSERLPKSYVEVLVCDDYGWINLGAYRPCDVSEDCSGWSIHAHTKIGTEEVVAWMPLPEPYKEGAGE